MKFNCSECGFSKPISEKYAGRMVKCPECKSSTRIDDSEFDGATAIATGSETANRTPAAVQSNNVQIRDYSINRSALGISVAYPCPACGQKLTSSLNDAGGTDHCPDCQLPFIVPGEKEFKEETGRRAADEVVRKATQEERTEASKKAVVNRVAQKALKTQNVQLDRDPLREWSIYVVIISALLILAAGKYMVSAVMNDSSYLCLVIFALFLVGLFMNFRGILRLRNEYVCAAVCMINLNKIDGMQLVKQGPAAGILHQHVMDLSNIARHDKSCTQDSLVALLYSRMMAQSKMVDVLSGVLVTLGLIGTIVGLISMTNGLSTTLASLGDDGAAADLLSGMRSTMSGLGTAFNTTLVGATLGSVVLRILNNVYTSNVDHLVTYVASTAEVSILPMLKQDSRARVLHEIT